MAAPLQEHSYCPCHLQEYYVQELNWNQDLEIISDSSGNNDNRQNNNFDMNARQVESTNSNSGGTNDTRCVLLQSILDHSILFF